MRISASHVSSSPNTFSSFLKTLSVYQYRRKKSVHPALLLFPDPICETTLKQPAPWGRTRGASMKSTSLAQPRGHRRGSGKANTGPHSSSNTKEQRAGMYSARQTMVGRWGLKNQPVSPWFGLNQHEREQEKHQELCTRRSTLKGEFLLHAHALLTGMSGLERVLHTASRKPQ